MGNVLQDLHVENLYNISASVLAYSQNEGINRVGSDGTSTPAVRVHFLALQQNLDTIVNALRRFNGSGTLVYKKKTSISNFNSENE